MTFSARFANMFGFLKKLLGLETPAPKKKQYETPTITVIKEATPVVHVETVTPMAKEKPKKKTTPKKSTSANKPRKKKD